MAEKIKMRIVILNTAASKTGALSILKDFYEYIKANDRENEYIFIVSDSYIEESDNIKVIVRDDIKKSRIKRLMFDKFEGAKFIKSLEPDVFFSMQNTAPNGYKGKTVLYVHQPLGFQKAKTFSFFKSNEREYAIYQHIICKMIDKSIKKCDKVIVQTKWMKEAIIKKTGISDTKVVNILPDVIIPEKFTDKDNTFSHTNMRNKNAVNSIESNDERKVRFFYPAGNILYKNHDVLVKASKLLKDKNISNFKVEITLQKEDLIGKTDMNLVDELDDIICFRGSLERETVFDTYMNSVLVFPSYIETFGYPLMETKVLGRYILASDEPFCHEILDGYENVQYFNAFNANELAILMEKVIEGTVEISSSADIKNNSSVNEGNSWGYVIKEIQNI